MPEALFQYEVEPITGQVAAVHRHDQSVAVGACLGAQHTVIARQRMRLKTFLFMFIFSFVQILAPKTT